MLLKIVYFRFSNDFNFNLQTLVTLMPAVHCTLGILLMMGCIKVNFGKNMKFFSFILVSNGPK